VHRGGGQAPCGARPLCGNLSRWGGLPCGVLPFALDSVLPILRSVQMRDVYEVDLSRYIAERKEELYRAIRTDREIGADSYHNWGLVKELEKIEKRISGWGGDKTA
jgi:hypothetical protein